MFGGGAGDIKIKRQYATSLKNLYKKILGKAKKMAIPTFFRQLVHGNEKEPLNISFGGKSIFCEKGEETIADFTVE